MIMRLIRSDVAALACSAGPDLSSGSCFWLLRGGLLHQASAEYFACSRYAFAAAGAKTKLTREVTQAARAFASGLFDLSVGDRFAYADVHAATLNRMRMIVNKERQ